MRALSEVSGAALPYNDVSAIRARMADISPTFDSLDTLQESMVVTPKKSKDKLDAAPLASGLADFYQVDAITRASQTMARARAVKAGIQPRGGLNPAEAGKWDAALKAAKADRIAEASNRVSI